MRSESPLENPTTGSFQSLSAEWLPTSTCFACAFCLSMVHWWLFNTMPDAASAVQSFFAVLHHGIGASNSLENVPVFGVHLWIAPLVALPFFALVPAYPVLVAVQAAVLALSVPAARRLALSTGMSHHHARQWTWFWAMNPMLLGQHCGLGEGYQPTIFAVTPILWSLASAREGRWKSFLAFLALALACREEVALTTLGIGIWVYWGLGNRRMGTIAILASLAWGTIAAALILPHMAAGHGSFVEKTISSLASSSGRQSVPVFLRIPFLSLLGFLYLAWGGFTTKGARLLVVTIPLLSTMFLEANWGTCNPFFHYTATLSPIFFLAALLESGPSGVFGKRWKLGWIFAAACLAVWQGRLLYHGIHGSDRESLTCLESKIPRHSSLALYSPRGASRFAWGQDLIWMDPANPPAEFTLVETGRKLPLAWTDTAELRQVESGLKSRGAHLAYEAPTVRLWALRNPGKIQCP